MKTPIVTGNTFDKYNTTNPIYRRLMSNFLITFLDLIDDTTPLKILEVGCGEGHLAAEIFSKKKVQSYHGFDIDEAMLSDAQKRCQFATLELGSAYDVGAYQDGSFDYVIVSEVMEHLEDSHAALKAISTLNSKKILFSVPNEPIWRILNVARLKYLSDLGNTPGHLKHWSRHSFGKLLSQYFTVETLTGSFPWTIALCSK